jgi:hypothetical protein
MKKTATLLLSFLITLSVFGQKIKGTKRISLRDVEMKKEKMSQRSEKKHNASQRKLKSPQNGRLSLRALPGEKLDSIVDSDGTYAEVYFYNEKGYVTEYKEYEKNNLDSTYLDFRSIHTYDNQGNELVDAGYYFNDSLEALAPSYKSTYTYDANNKKLSEEFISFKRNTTYQYSYEYDNSGNLITEFYTSGDNKSKYTYAYNVDNLLILEENYYWNEGDYQLGGSDTIKYDANNNDTLKVGDYSKTIKTFDNNNNVLIEIDYYYQYDEILQDYKWVPSYKYVYTYANNKETSVSYYNWVDSTSLWEYDNYGAKYEYSYDVNGNNTQYISYQYDTTLSQLVPDYKEVYSFDLTKSGSSALIPYPEYYTDPNRITGESYYYYNDGWQNDEELVYHYSSFSSCGEYFTTSYDASTNVFTLILNPNTTANATSYLWDFGDGSTSTQAKPSHEFTNNEYYNVCLKITGAGNDECSYCRIIGKDDDGNVLRTEGFSMVVKEQSDLTAVSPIDVSINNLSIYPNPTSGSVTVKTLESAAFELLTIQGQVLLTKEVSGTSTISLETIPQGIFIYKIADSNGNIKTGKLVVE